MKTIKTFTEFLNETTKDYIIQVLKGSIVVRNYSIWDSSMQDTIDNPENFNPQAYNYLLVDAIENSELSDYFEIVSLDNYNPEKGTINISVKGTKDEVTEKMKKYFTKPILLGMNSDYKISDTYELESIEGELVIEYMK